MIATIKVIVYYDNDQSEDRVIDYDGIDYIGDVLASVVGEEIEDYKVIDWYDLPLALQDMQVLQEIALDYDHIDEDVILAGIALDIPLQDIEEAYQGEFNSDEDFAIEMADGLCEIPQSWPHYCIDWGFAAKELMHDYCEHNGHYFRRM